jgi:hypothetical protein
MIKKLYVPLILSFSLGFFLIFPNASHSNEIMKFAKIMALMNGADVRYERVGHYSDIPFKLDKEGDNWELQQMRNKQWGTVTDAGNNKILLEGFSRKWTILGTWKFSKDENRCRIDHTMHDSNGTEPMNMQWECNK